MKNLFQKVIAWMLVVVFLQSDFAAIAETLDMLTLPVALKVIEEEAFYGNSSIEKIIIPEGVEEIEKKAFAYSSANVVELPESLTHIAEDAFDECDDLLFYVHEGSYAEEWCSDNNYDMLVVGGTPTPPSEEEASQFEYSIKNNEVEITGYIGKNTDVVIPEIIDNYFVTRIGNFAFQAHKSLTSISLPEALTHIGMLAFEGCSNLTNIAISDGVASVGWGAFNGCDQLMVYCNAGTTAASTITDYGLEFFDLDYPNIRLMQRTNQDKTYYLEVAGCTASETEISIPSSINAVPINVIDAYAFSGHSDLTTVVLPEGLTHIGMSAFSGCEKLKEIIIPDSVTSIGFDAFYGCDQLIMNCNAGSIGATAITEYGWYFSDPDYPGIWLKQRASLDKKYYLEVAGCAESITDVYIPESINGIPVTSVAAQAFSNCSDLTSISLPESLLQIGKFAFNGCTSLSEITLPKKLESINVGIFWGCEQLTVYCYAGTAAASMITDTNLYFSDPSYPGIWLKQRASLDKKYYLEVAGCAESITDVYIPESINGIPVTSIAAQAFSNRSDLTSISLPESLLQIGKFAFNGCTSLSEITLPKKLESINIGAFWNCGDILFFVCENSYAEEWCLENGYTIEYVSEDDEETITANPTVSNYKINNTATELTVKEGDTLSFSGVINAPEGASITAALVSVFKEGTAQQDGEEYYPAANLNTSTYDLSNTPALVVGQPFGETNYTMTAGNSYLVMLYTTDSNGNGFIDYDPTVEGPQGPSILVHVTAKDEPGTEDPPAEPFVKVYDASGNDLNGKTIDFGYNKFSGKTVYVLSNLDITPWLDVEDAFKIDRVSTTYTDEGSLVELKLSGSENPYATARTREMRIYENGKSGKNDKVWATITLAQAGNPNVPVVGSAQLIDGNQIYDNNNAMQLAVGDHNYEEGEGYVLNVQSNAGADVVWTVYTDDVNVAKAYRSEDGLVHINAKATGKTNLYISNVYVKEETLGALPDDAYIYKVCSITISPKIISGGDVVPAPDYSLFADSKYYYEGSENYLFMSETETVNIWLEKPNGELVSPNNTVNFSVIVSPAYDGLVYQNGYIRLNRGGDERGILQLIDSHGAIVSSIYVLPNRMLLPPEYTGLKEEIGIMTLDAFAEKANEKWIFGVGDKGAMIGDGIEIQDVTYSYVPSSSSDSSEGCYTVEWNTYNFSSATYGVKIVDASGNPVGDMEYIGGYTPSISIVDFVTKWSYYCAETHISVQVPVGGKIEFVQLSESDELMEINAISVVLECWSSLNSFKNVITPIPTGCGTCLDLKVLLGALNKDLQKDMVRTITKAVLTGGVKAIKEILESETPPEWWLTLKDAALSSIGKAVVTKVEDMILYATTPVGFYVTNTADYVAKVLTVEEHMVALTTEMNGRDNFLLDTVIIPMSGN